MCHRTPLSFHPAPPLPRMASSADNTNLNINEDELIAELESKYGWSDIRTTLDTLYGNYPAGRQLCLQNMMPLLRTPNILGTKPTSDDPQPGTYRIDIPDDDLCIRVFPGGTTAQEGFYFFDFYCMDTQNPIDTPKGYVIRLEGRPGIGPERSDPIESLEAGPGFQIPRGSMKYSMNDGARMTLERANKETFVFDLPTRLGRRHAAEAGVGQPVLMH
ncbi:hypothetical protein FB45DRAFT_913415 [Roridomyces roridus]|uniref:Uncharacterized protein n=1 Tax=Roridomyces roridus TaxID=1738132 RepID=A0AAD7FMU2_9AGAR|nr:hypothetical protein FB45DRAFT_913415 [Roridomyces roridus]